MRGTMSLPSASYFALSTLVRLFPLPAPTEGTTPFFPSLTNESVLDPLRTKSCGDVDRDPVGVLSPEASSGGVPECRSMNEGIDLIGVGGTPE
jgi:hypothetical protein